MEEIPLSLSSLGKLDYVSKMTNFGSNSFCVSSSKSICYSLLKSKGESLHVRFYF